MNDLYMSGIVLVSVVTGWYLGYCSKEDKPLIRLPEKKEDEEPKSYFDK